MEHFSNAYIAKILREMSVLYEISGIEFKPRAYEKAALSLESLNEEAYNLYKQKGTKALDEIPGVGAGIARHIEELLKTGHFKEYDRLKKKLPVQIDELVSVEGVGPQTIKVLWNKLKIKNIAGLEKAARDGKIRSLPHFGKLREEKILKGIAFAKKTSGRKILGYTLPEIRSIEEIIKRFPETDTVAIAGSIRRKKETIGDIDILVTSKNPKKIMNRFVMLPFVAHIYAKGETKTNVRLKSGIDADLRVVPRESWGAALNYFTGSKAHNVHLREMALKRGWKLNEYGLWKGKKIIAGKTEDELYKKLGLRYIEPELREMTGEIEAARANNLPDLIQYGDLKGDLQIQTNWTDGKDSIEEMARAARAAGLRYIAITDHTKTLAVTKGTDEKKLLRQMKEIEKVNAKLKRQKSEFRVLTGAEVNIMKDGSLDIEDDVLEKLGVVGASVHSHFDLSREEQTKRVIRAMENKNVDMIFHLTTRIIERRKPIEVDIDAVIEAARKTRTILEINASPDRLDIPDEYIRKCVEAGVKMCINSDAHAKEHFKFLEFGIAQARRGWAEKKDIVNTLPLEKFLKTLKHR